MVSTSVMTLYDSIETAMGQEIRRSSVSGRSFQGSDVGVGGFIEGLDLDPDKSTGPGPGWRRFVRQEYRARPLPAEVRCLSSVRMGKATIGVIVVAALLGLWAISGY